MESKEMDWRRCSEGFAGLLKPDVSRKRKKPTLSSKSSEPGNIFEKLALQSDEEKSQPIAWSSSDSEEEGQLPSKQQTISTAIKQSVRGRAKQAIPKHIETRAKTTPRSRSAKRLKLETTEDVMIELHKSDSEEEIKKPEDLIDDIETDEKQEQNTNTNSLTSSPQITDAESISSQPSSSSEAAVVTAGGVKVSDWVKSLHLKTPKKSEQSAKDVKFEDSGKKKKQPRGGVADQLSRLQAREKSAVRMWNHEQTKSASQETKSLFFEVVGFDTLYSINIVRCVPCDTHRDLTQVGPPSSHKLVMFPAEQFEHLNMAVGTQFRIFPPWQQLALNDDQEIVMCTKYCRVMSREGQGDTCSMTPEMSPETSVTGHVTNTLDKLQACTVTAHWKCPCVQGVSRGPTACPAYQFPTVPGMQQLSETSPVDQKSASSENDKSVNNNKGSTSRLVPSHHSSHLITVCASPVARSGTRLFQGNSTVVKSGDTTKPLSLLESIQKTRTSDNIDGNTVSGVCFRGFIHRAVLYCGTNNETRCRLLVEDSQGCMCEVHLSEKALTGQGLNISSCCGKTFNFSGLSVIQRITRDRDTCLFTLLDTVWSGRGHQLDSQDSYHSNLSTAGETESVQLGYCYLLEGELDGCKTVRLEPCETNILQYREHVYMPLQLLHKPSTTPTRQSTCVKLLLKYKPRKKPGCCVLYVTDSSLTGPNNYTTVEVQSACNLGNIVSHTADKQLILLRDLYCSNGTIQADGYTLVLLAADETLPPSNLREMVKSVSGVKLYVDQIHSSTGVGQLCLVQGQISDVDEESAYSWDECVHCDSDKLQNSGHGLIKCVQCNKTMRETRTRLKMEVMVQCPGLAGAVRVDLCQATIERLLPQEDGDDDGYELNSVLNKEIGPLTCVVTATDVPEYTCVLEEVWTGS